MFLVEKDTQWCFCIYPEKEQKKEVPKEDDREAGELGIGVAEGMRRREECDWVRYFATQIKHTDHTELNKNVWPTQNEIKHALSLNDEDIATLPFIMVEGHTYKKSW